MKQKELNIISIDNEHGYQRPSDRKMIGEKSIQAFIEGYGNVSEAPLTVFWGFDENSKLIDI